MMLASLVALHTNLFYWMYGFIGSSLVFDRVILLLAEGIDIYVVLVAIIFILTYQHAYREANQKIFKRQVFIELIVIFSGVAFAWAVSYLMKIGFALPRPFLRFEGLDPLFFYGGYNSFPSGHATLFASLATAIYLLHRKVGIIFILLAVLISLARVIAGVHFPIDILVGWVLGFTTSYFAFRFISFSLRPIKKTTSR